MIKELLKIFIISFSLWIKDLFRLKKSTNFKQKWNLIFKIYLLGELFLLLLPKPLDYYEK